jgi:hypothetical protein
LLVASRSPPLRVAVEVIVRDPFAEGRAALPQRSALLHRRDRLRSAAGRQPLISFTLQSI